MRKMVFVQYIASAIVFALLALLAAPLALPKLKAYYNYVDSGIHFAAMDKKEKTK